MNNRTDPEVDDRTDPDWTAITHLQAMIESIRRGAYSDEVQPWVSTTQRCLAFKRLYPLAHVNGHLNRGTAVGLRDWIKQRNTDHTYNQAYIQDLFSWELDSALSLAVNFWQVCRPIIRTLDDIHERLVDSYDMYR